jgi:hypothetical protein
MIVSTLDGDGSNIQPVTRLLFFRTMARVTVFLKNWSNFPNKINSLGNCDCRGVDACKKYGYAQAGIHRNALGSTMNCRFPKSYCK